MAYINHENRFAATAFDKGGGGGGGGGGLMHPLHGGVHTPEGP